MKISSRISKSLNTQIAMEAYASNYYLSMASWCEVAGYEGASKFFYAQSDEERQHMIKIIHYLNGVGIQAVIPVVKEPAKIFKSLEAIIKIALGNEQAVTKAIHSMVEIAQKDNDHSSFNFLQWFVNEQIEEEKLFETILLKFDVIGRDKLAINEIDKYLGSIKTQN